LVQEIADEEAARLAAVKEAQEAAAPAETAPSAAGGDNAVATVDDPVQDIMQFPSIVTGKLIGSRGSQIADIRAQSGAKVSVEKGDEFCKVHIAGTQEQVDSARKIVRDLAEAGLMGAPTDGSTTDNMEVPHSMVGRILGRGGETIKRLQKESGARIRVNANEGDPVIVRIRLPDACARARFLVADVLDRGNNFGDDVVPDRGPRPPPPPPSAAWGPPGVGGHPRPGPPKQYEAPKKLDIDLDEL